MSGSNWCDKCFLKAIPGAEELLPEGKSKQTYFKRGEDIFREGSVPIALYCLCSGKVKLYQYGIDGREQIIRLVKPGEAIGYRALMAGTKFSASAAALDDSEVMMIPADEFRAMMESSREFRSGMVKMLADKLAESDRRILEMAYKPVKARVAEALLLIYNTYAENSPDFEFHVSRNDLAALVGTAKESLIRVLSEFKENRLIASSGWKLKILDLKKLEEISMEEKG